MKHPTNTINDFYDEPPIDTCKLLSLLYEFATYNSALSYYTELLMENAPHAVEYNHDDGFISIEAKKGFYDGMVHAFNTIAMMIENGEMDLAEGVNLYE